jgi:hypothetical protein
VLAVGMQNSNALNIAFSYRHFLHLRTAFANRIWGTKTQICAPDGNQRNLVAVRSLGEGMPCDGARAQNYRLVDALELARAMPDMAFFLRRASKKIRTRSSTIYR